MARSSDSAKCRRRAAFVLLSRAGVGAYACTYHRLEVERLRKRLTVYPIMKGPRSHRCPDPDKPFPTCSYVDEPECS